MFHAARRVVFPVTALLFSLASLALPAADLKDQTLPVPNRGSVMLSAPAAWNENIKPQQDAVPPSITFTGAEPAQFLVTVTPFWSATRDPAFNSSDNVRARLDKFAKRAEAGGTTVSPVRSLAGTGGRAVYFSAVDKDSGAKRKPGDFKYLTTVGYALDDLYLVMEVLTSEPDTDEVKAAIKMIVKARRG